MECVALKMSPICSFLVAVGEGLGIGVFGSVGLCMVTSHLCFQIAHCDAASIVSVIWCSSVLLWLMPNSFSSLVIGLLSNLDARFQTGSVVGHWVNLWVIVSCGACGEFSFDGVGWRCLQMEQIPVGPLKLHGRALWKIRYLSWLYLAGKNGNLLDLIFVGNVWRRGVVLVLVG